MYKSQYKQDKFLDSVVFSKKKNGFFLDIGAHDGETYSNSFFFEKYRKWQGVCVEPNPHVYNKLIKIRNSFNYNACIGNENKIVDFSKIEGYSEMLSGVTSSYNKEHLDRIKKEITKFGGKVEVIKSEMILLEDIVELKNKIIDFISIDTEGNELDILKSINYKNHHISCIVVENNYNNIEIDNLLTSKGFLLLYKLSCDQVFIHKSIYTNKIRFNLFVWKLNLKTKRILKKIGLRKL